MAKDGKYSKLKRALVAFAILFFAPLHSFADQILESTSCKGYRYSYMTQLPDSDKVDFYACRDIEQPSSKPVQCEHIGQIDTKKISDTTYLVGKKIVSYKRGIIAGASCVIIAQVGSFFNEPVSTGMRAFNFGAATSEFDALREETRSGQRELGSLPKMDSKRTRAVSGICSTMIGGKKKGEFQSGAELSIQTFLSIGHRIMGIQADSREVWTTTDSVERERRFKEFKKNVEATRALEIKAATTSFNAVKAVYDYFTSTEMVDIPFGLSSEMAVVPADSCIPFPEMETLKKYISVLNLATEQAKLLLKDENLAAIADGITDSPLNMLGYQLSETDAVHLGFAKGNNIPTLDNENCVANLYKTKLFDLTEKPAEACEDKESPSPIDGRTTTNLANIVSVAKLRGEAEFYSVAAKEHATELQCTITKLPELLADKEREQDILKLFKQLRSIKDKITKAAVELTMNPAISAKICPLTMKELIDYKNTREPEHFVACKTLIQGRAAYQATENAIPLSNTEAIREFMSKYVDYTDEKLQTEDFSAALKNAYTQAAKELAGGVKHLDQLSIDESELKNRNAQLALLSDPLITSLAIQNAKNYDDVLAAACKADLDFTHTGGYFDPTPYVSSLYTDGRPALSPSGDEEIEKVSNSAQAARITGAISNRAVKIIQTTVQFAQNPKNFESLGKKCENFANTSSDSCHSIPSAKRFKQDLCILETSIAAMGFAP